MPRNLIQNLCGHKKQFLSLGTRQENIVDLQLHLSPPAISRVNMSLEMALFI